MDSLPIYESADKQHNLQSIRSNTHEQKYKWIKK